MSYPQIDPIAFHIFGIAVYWYGVAYLAAFFAGHQYLKYRSKKFTADGLGADQAEDVFMWIVLGIILGGRLGYVLFYNPAYFFEHPTAILQMWNGGMSFHGGFAGVLIASLLFCRKHNIHFFDLMDRVAPGVCFGLFFGRIANFINGELYGRVTDVPWAMVFPTGGPLTRHPSQLYEAALEGIVLFLILHFSAKTKLVRYRTSGLFLIGYGSFRSFVEFFRQGDNIPHLQEGIFTSISMGQILSLPMIAFGLYLIHLSRKDNAHVSNANS